MADLDFRSLTPAECRLICEEIVAKSRHGNPQHFRLIADVERAWFLALNSAAFRTALAAALSGEATNG